MASRCERGAARRHETAADQKMNDASRWPPTRSCWFCSSSARRPRSALYPAPLHPKWATPRLPSPSLQKSAEDVELPFERAHWNALLSGAEIRGEDPLIIPDAELASLRRARSLELLCDGVLPETLPEVLRLSAGPDRCRRPASATDFERTVLTLVYAAQTAARAERRRAWAGSLVRLFRAVRKDLGPSATAKDRSGWK
ncbi:protein FAM180A isoform X2 [Syngnathoides biaculeatus]|uniref:protein FAM180A isoform X2 n=1 Tax=Syngnathoides biaculeatus TaxID=300417 RepID=UPI002ADDFAF2|nr:protein FAM180A isoform X2 [Syngnathoides biaculeatus]